MKFASGPVMLLAVLATLIFAPAAGAKPASLKKAIWGPVTLLDGTSAFPTYKRLGVGIFELSLSWSDVAPTRPAKATDPSDPAYRWPDDIDFAIREGRRHGIRVMLMGQTTPGWANGGRPPIWVPDRPQDYADFLMAAAKRYPDVKHWMIWGEPSKKSNFQPMVPEPTEGTGTALTPAQAKAPRYYARMLDMSYAALKRVRRNNLVIGGNTYTNGSISPLNWLYYMRLPNGRRPRMDLYGHNPFTLRRPDLRKPLFVPGSGFADFSDLDALYGWLKLYGYRNSSGRPLSIFISEFALPTDHPNWEFNAWFDRKLAASWLADALRITRRTPWIYSLGWLGLYDSPPRPAGDETNFGLLDLKGNKKPAYFAYRDG